MAQLDCLFNFSFFDLFLFQFYLLTFLFLLALFFIFTFVVFVYFFSRYVQTYERENRRVWANIRLFSEILTGLHFFYLKLVYKKPGIKAKTIGNRQEY